MNHSKRNLPSHTTPDAAALAETGLSLVYAIAAKIYKSTNRRVEFDELVSFGTIGLMQATTRYDRGSGAQFTTFAYYRIHGAIIDGLRSIGAMTRNEHRRYKLQSEADQPSARAVSSPARQRATAPTAEADLTQKRTRHLLHDAMRRLPERESYLIRSFYYGDKQLGDAGRDLGISKSWTSRLHDRALARLRNDLRDYSFDTLAA